MHASGAVWAFPVLYSEIDWLFHCRYLSSFYGSPCDVVHVTVTPLSRGAFAACQTVQTTMSIDQFVADAREAHRLYIPVCGLRLTLTLSTFLGALEWIRALCRSVTSLSHTF